MFEKGVTKEEFEKFKKGQEFGDDIIIDRLDKIDAKIKTIPTENLQNVANLNARVQELEIWQSKMHQLLVDKTPTGREKLSQSGRRIYGGRYRG